MSELTRRIRALSRSKFAQAWLHSHLIGIPVTVVFSGVVHRLGTPFPEYQDHADENHHRDDERQTADTCGVLAKRVRSALGVRVTEVEPSRAVGAHQEVALHDEP